MPVLLLLALSAAGPAPARPVQVTADKLEVQSQNNRAFFRNHAKAVRDSTTVTCDTIEVVMGENHEVASIIATGNVLAIDQDRQATGQRAVYDNLTGVLTVTGEPEARQGKRRVRGDTVRFTTGNDRVEVDEPRTVLDDEKPQGSKEPGRISIDAHHLVLESAQNVARWSGAVKTVRGPTTLRAPLLEAHYDGAGAVTHVIAKGGVEVTEGDKWAQGARADFDNTTGVLVVTGNPQARQGNDRMKGSKVIWSSGGELLEVENATTILSIDKNKKR